MKFAFSTDCCPDWDFPTIAGKAREHGYDGVEISGMANAADMPARLKLEDPAGNLEVLGALKSASIDIACIAAPVRLTGDRRADVGGAAELRRWIDLSAELACSRVMLRDPEPRRGMSGLAAGMALGEWLAPIADHALAREITLLVCNDATLAAPRLMWAMLERLRHPAVACCWDLDNGVRAGESPALAVPTLNSQIRYARVGDAVPATAPNPREPRSGCDVQLFLTRLRGIGYDGYVTAAGRATVPDEYLSGMALMLKKWGAPATSVPVARRKQETRPKAG